MPPFIEPLQSPYEPEVAEELSRLMGGSTRPPLHLFRTLAKHLPLAKAWGVLGSHNLARGALTVRDRELIILRTCYLDGCEYEWGVHARIYSKAAGLSEAQYLATACPSFDHPSWSAHDRDVLAFAEAMRAAPKLPQALRARLGSEWSEAQLLEACEIAGYYHGVSCIVEASGVELEEWGARFP